MKIELNKYNDFLLDLNNDLVGYKNFQTSDSLMFENKEVLILNILDKAIRLNSVFGDFLISPPNGIYLKNRFFPLETDLDSFFNNNTFLDTKTKKELNFKNIYQLLESDVEAIDIVVSKNNKMLLEYKSIGIPISLFSDKPMHPVIEMKIILEFIKKYFYNLSPLRNSKRSCDLDYLEKFLNKKNLNNKNTEYFVLDEIYLFLIQSFYIEFEKFIKTDLYNIYSVTGGEYSSIIRIIKLCDERIILWTKIQEELERIRNE